MFRGLRNAFGVRKSAPYGDSQLNNPNRNGQFNISSGLPTSSILVHANSLQSSGSVDMDSNDTPKPDDGFKPNIDRTMASKNGFVLVAKPLDVPMPSSSGVGSLFTSKFTLSDNKISGQTQLKRNQNVNNANRRGSLTAISKLGSSRIPNSSSRTTQTIFRGLWLRRQKSTSDLDSSMYQDQRTGGASGSGSGSGNQSATSDINIPLTLSPEELDITDPTTVETYTGEWKLDKRNGHGVCERSDGLKYEGQWHNDMKCGYGVTTFKDGSKEEGKYKNNILIVDGKMKKFFHFNIRQRIDDAVKKAHQAQKTALNKAEIADNRAATARDKSDQATTAALEAAKDSQIAYEVARQYSGSQMNVPVSYTAGGDFSGLATLDPMGMTNMGLMIPTPTGINLNQGPRRISIAGHTQLHGPRFPDSQQMFSSDQQRHQHQSDLDQMGSSMTQAQNPFQTHQASMFVTQNDPSNGRRGSYRGGSVPPTSNVSGSQYGVHPSTSVRQRSTADPFNDIFDHYKSNSSMATRRSFSKQTSIEQDLLSGPYHKFSNQRASSVARQMGQSDLNRVGSRLSKFRMSSMDHAEENQQYSSLDRRKMHRPLDPYQQQVMAGSNDQNQVQQDGNSMQQQLRHLVTSGEEMQKSQSNSDRFSINQQPTTSQPHQSDLSSRLNQQQQQSAIQQQHQTPTPNSNSSYILPQSTNSSSFFGQQTPSPEGQTENSFVMMSTDNTNRSMPTSYMNNLSGVTGTAFARSNFQPAQQSFRQVYIPGKQRDVQSLADERLYRYPLSSMESPFSNYDFTIKSGPRLRERNLRRTASLTQSAVFINNQTTIENSRLTIDSKHTTSSHGLARKPSLQVRYDPVAMGGLMSREEVAAMSHAQREQKRIEAELAERRTKRPFLHLYLTIRDYVKERLLAISVLLVNMVLVKLFVDLIT